MSIKPLFALLALVPALAGASTLWKGDFSSGDFSQWTDREEVSSDRLQLVSNATTQGRYALQAKVIQGDNPINASGNRNELEYMSNDAEGSEFFYSWSTLFPEDYASVRTWQVFTQWHQAGCCGSPPIAFYTNGEEVRVDLGGGVSGGLTVWRVPLVRGVWHTFVLHVRWSEDPSRGWIEIYYDGALSLPKTLGHTGAGTYVKQGLYRDAAVAPTETIFHAGMVKGTQLSDVQPVPPPAPPASNPDSGAAAPPVSSSPDAGTLPSAAPQASPSSLPTSGLPTSVPQASIVHGEPYRSMVKAQGCGAAPVTGPSGFVLVAVGALLVLRRRVACTARGTGVHPRTSAR